MWEMSPDMINILVRFVHLFFMWCQVSVVQKVLGLKCSSASQRQGACCKNSSWDSFIQSSYLKFSVKMLNVYDLSGCFGKNGIEIRVRVYRYINASEKIFICISLSCICF